MTKVALKHHPWPVFTCPGENFLAILRSRNGLGRGDHIISANSIRILLIHQEFSGNVRAQMNSSWVNFNSEIACPLKGIGTDDRLCAQKFFEAKFQIIFLKNHVCLDYWFVLSSTYTMKYRKEYISYVNVASKLGQLWSTCNVVYCSHPIICFLQKWIKQANYLSTQNLAKNIEKLLNINKKTKK